MRTWSKDEWLIAYCKILPTVAEGTEAFTLAWNEALASPHNVLRDYFDYLASGRPALTQAQLQACVHDASVLALSLDYILDLQHADRATRFIINKIDLTSE